MISINHTTSLPQKCHDAGGLILTRFNYQTFVKIRFSHQKPIPQSANHCLPTLNSMWRQLLGWQQN